jgi:hypothetical protein
MDALASGSWLSRERVTAIAAISGVCGALMLLALWLLGHGTLDPFGKPIGADFTAFWNAGHLADTGAPAAAWNQQLLNDTIRHTHGVEYGTAWIYPPVFLLVAAPLGAMSYLPALLVWQLLSLICVALVLRSILESRRDTLVALASPLSALVLANGQNSLITAALLGGGLLLLARQPWVGGALLGMLIYKPQLGIVILPLLIFTRNWRALGGAALAAVVLVGLSVFLWGPDCWPAWLSSLRYGRFYMEHGSVGLYKSASLFSMARTWGAGAGAAYAVQSLGILVAVGCVWLLRSSTNLTRAAAVCVPLCGGAQGRFPVLRTQRAGPGLVRAVDQPAGIGVCAGAARPDCSCAVDVARLATSLRASPSRR